MINYVYNLRGTAADGQTFTVKGTVSSPQPGMFMEAVDAAMRDAFSKLTHGLAVYGNPGQGCKGPYRMTTLLLSEEGQ